MSRPPNSEANFQGRVKKAIKRPNRVWWKLQDAFLRGLPDSIVCIQGNVTWLEYKYVSRWPKRRGTKVKIDLSVEQRRRLAEWAAAGGAGYCLLGVENDWFLLPHDCPDALDYEGLVRAAVLRGECDDFSRLVDWLS